MATGECCDPDRPPKEMGRGGFVFAALLNVVGLIVLNNHDWWRPLLGGVVTERFEEVLWAANLDSGVRLACNLALVAYPSGARRRAVELVTACTGGLSAVVALWVFPFDLQRFGAWAETVGRTVLWLAIVGSTIAGVVALVRLLSLGAGAAARAYRGTPGGRPA